MGIHTQYKFRHYGVDPDSGMRALLWASDGEKASIMPRSDELILPGSDLELEVVHSQLWTQNTVADEGEKDILDVYFDDVAVRTTLYFSLHNDAAITEADTMATIGTEVTEGGYARIAVTRGTDWSDPSAAAGTTSTTKQFAATATWTQAQALVLNTAVTGTAGLHIAWANLSVARNLVNGDTLDVDMTVVAEGV